MTSMRWKVAVAAGALCVLATAGNARALPLLPGPGTDLTPVPQVVWGAGLYTVETLLASTSGADDTTPADRVLATFWTAVYRNSLGTLDFLYQVRNDSVSPAEILNRETDVDFDSFTTDVAQTAPNAAAFGIFQVGTQITTQADRSADGSTVGFLWRDLTLGTPLLDPNEISTVKIIRTNATLWTVGRTSAIDGGVAAHSAFAPTAVPEPGSMLLLGTGLFGLAGALRRRMKK